MQPDTQGRLSDLARHVLGTLTAFVAVWIATVANVDRLVRGAAKWSAFPAS